MFPLENLLGAQRKRLGAISAGCAFGAALFASALCQSAPARTNAVTVPLPFAGGKFALQEGDVLAFLGGADVVGQLRTGHLESLLAIKFHGRGARFRNFGWEGDTVFEQPRDLNFPSLQKQLERAAASVIALQFGRAEALDGRDKIPEFQEAYRKLLEACSTQTPRLVLVTPPPFEKGSEFLPDLSARNSELAAYAQVIRDLARERRLPLVDLFAELGGVAHRELELTDNGINLTARAHARMAQAFARQLGFGNLAHKAGKAKENGAWPNARFERVRQAIVAKNQLWFNYWRPQNWAFLGGDRISQPSSRDHLDPKIRWFPAEMERYLPLIEAKERQIDQLSAEALQRRGNFRR